MASTSRPPFLSDSVHKSLDKTFEKVNLEVEKSIKEYCDYLKDDPIYEKLSELFELRILEPFSEEELEKIYKEGEERYKKKIPPGFEDERKGDKREYGDLILWKQVVGKAKKTKTSIIFITDERKKDWWWKIKDGRNMGPRQELVEEMNREASVDFHMYSSERFLSYGQKILNEVVNEKALKEIKAMKNVEASIYIGEEIYYYDNLEEIEFQRKDLLEDLHIEEIKIDDAIMTSELLENENHKEIFTKIKILAEERITEIKRQLEILNYKEKRMIRQLRGKY